MPVFAAGVNSFRFTQSKSHSLRATAAAIAGACALCETGVMTLRVISLLLVGLVACAGSQREVAVQGTDNELIKLAGNWQGDYQGNESGRSGPITFDLRLGQHSAEGEVRMGGTTPLKIEFVTVKDSQVRGTIAPYTDPACSCQVETTFLGTRTGDEIAGRFDSKLGATGQTQTGSWQVKRTSR